MVSAAVWISSTEARVFSFLPTGVEIHRLHHDGPDHHAETDGRNHPKKGGDVDHFLHKVAEYMVHSQAQRWLVLGPGVVKSQFQHHIEKHHAQHSKKIVAVEAMDKSTDGEIQNFSHDLFKKLGVFL